MGVHNYPRDTMNPISNWDRPYQVCLRSFDDGRPREVADLSVYTDGSHCGGYTGGGFVVMRGDALLATESFYLGSISTVFQAEVSAIGRASDYVREHYSNALAVTFFVDSQAAM